MKTIEIFDQNNLVPTSKFPCAKFPYEEFNPVQSSVFDIYDKPNNALIAASTSSGKTTVAEMFLSHEVRVRKGKGLFLGPLKALTQEKIDDWTDPSHHFSDLNLSICTGDYRLTADRKEELVKSDIIVMTSELLNSRCRNYQSENNTFLHDIGTIVVDESHLLTVPGRGGHLEVGIMKLTEINPNCRIVFLSATMPNVKEIAAWLSHLNDKDTHVLESRYRPVPLTVHYTPYDDSINNYMYKEEAKVSTALQIVKKYKDDKFLIFAHGKEMGKKMVNALANLKIESEFHNADMDKAKRVKLETRFKKDKDFRVLVATSTLAWGCLKHGSFVLGKDAKPIKIEDVKVGTTLLCPVNQGFENKKVLGIKDFKKDEAYFIKLESGETLTVSADHLFWAAAGRNAPSWTTASELMVRDFLSTPADLGLWTNKSDIDEFWYFVGLVFGDGCLTKSGIHADGCEKYVLDLCLSKRDEFAELIRLSFNAYFDADYLLKDDMNGVPHITTKRRDIVERFTALLPKGRKLGEHDVPVNLFGNQKLAASFLRGWFDADGGVENHGNGNMSVGLACISRLAIQSAKNLLLCFGISCSTGRKRMKDTIVNGRLQKPTRKWSYRLRIFGMNNLTKFSNFIGFNHEDKQNLLNVYLRLITVDKKSKDIIPARSLIKTHLEANGLKSVDLQCLSGMGLWANLHRQDAGRATLRKLVQNTDVKTPLNDIVDNPIKWSKIKEIRLCGGGTFREIEVEEPHAYVGNGVISHNCNVPARRVIILGPYRGMEEVATYDITQMIGRSGRKGLDPEGDAYILLPRSKMYQHTTRLQTPQQIISQLINPITGDFKELAFHVVSEIHRGSIQTIDDLYKWYDRTLASFQERDLNHDTATKMLNILKARRIIMEDPDDNNKLKTTPLGAISSLFYYPPFEVADLKKNFTALFDNHKEMDDHWISMALANTEQHRMGFVSAAEEEQVGIFNKQISKRQLVEELGSYGNFYPGTVKVGYCYHMMLNGTFNPVLMGLLTGLKRDYGRLAEVLVALDSMAAKWGKKDYLRKLNLRLEHGVDWNLLELCRLKGIGKAKAKRMWDANLKNLDQIAAKPHVVKVALGCSDKVAATISENAKSLI